jgi:hypothetical protein
MSMAKRYAAVFAGAMLATVGIGAVPASAGTLADRSSTLPDPPAVVMVRALAGLPGTGSILCYYNSTPSTRRRPPARTPQYASSRRYAPRS